MREPALAGALQPDEAADQAAVGVLEDAPGDASALTGPGHQQPSGKRPRVHDEH